MRDAFDNRSESDYGVLKEFHRVDVLKNFEDMKDFIATVEEYIARPAEPGGEDSTGKIF